MKGARIAIVAATAALLSGSAEPTKKDRFVVFTLESNPEHKALAQKLTDEILIHLSKRKDLTAMGQEELLLTADFVKDRSDFTIDDCRRASECLAKIVEIADTEHLISGSVGKLSESYVVTLSLMDANKMIVVKKETCSAENDEALVEEMRRTIDLMLGSGETRERTIEVNTSGTKVMVLPLAGLEEISRTLTQILALELGKAGMSVLTWEEVSKTLEYAVARENCKGEGDLTECFAEIGGALGVDYLAVAAAGRLQEQYLITLKLIDLQAIAVEHRLATSYQGPESQLPIVFRHGVNQLLGRKLEGAGELNIVTDVEGTLTVDTSSKALPLSQPISGLSAGKHSISIVDADEEFWPFFADAMIDPGLTTRIEPLLVARPVPWYRSWWFIASVSAAVVAGTVTTFLLLQEEGGEVDTGVGRLGVKL